MTRFKNLSQHPLGYTVENHRNTLLNGEALNRIPHKYKLRMSLICSDEIISVDCTHIS